MNVVDLGLNERSLAPASGERVGVRGLTEAIFPQPSPLPEGEGTSSQQHWAVMFMGLVSIMWSTGAGSDNIKRIAAPMIVGIFTSFLMELLVYPAICEVWRRYSHVKKAAVKSKE